MGQGQLLPPPVPPPAARDKTRSPRADMWVGEWCPLLATRCPAAQGPELPLRPEGTGKVPVGPCSPAVYGGQLTTLLQVIQRIFYTVNRSWSGRITCAELRRSSFLQNVALLEEEADINQLTEFFSYEHFYVIYCKFWELDTDHDLLIDAQDLARHNDHGEYAAPGGGTLAPSPPGTPAWPPPRAPRTDAPYCPPVTSCSPALPGHSLQDTWGTGTQAEHAGSRADAGNTIGHMGTEQTRDTQ
uniref:PP2A regulatory subunit B'' EF-hand domain-containing protein n=1 Tax=Sus scrofa TaxID=9823 RepID=A0A8D0S800_PIG